MASRRPRRRARIAVAAAPALVALAAVTACSGAGALNRGNRNPLQVNYEAVVRKTLPSVVEITAGDSTGSGVVFDGHGDIVTNAHVVGTAKTFEVTSSVLNKAVKAHLVGLFGPDDIAVIKVNEDANELKPANWADSADVQVGAIVLAMGSPYGLVDSVTQGIVSATGRTVTGPKANGQPPSAIADAIQTSAAINPGNSGGALVMLSGAVLGIPTLAAQDPQQGTAAEGIGFAIPSNTVTDIAGQLIDKGKVTTSDRASLQIQGRTHVNSSAQPDGVTVDTVQTGGAAAKAGIKSGDVIVGLGGNKVSSLNQLEDELVSYRPGERVQVEILRNGAPSQVSVELGSLSS